jgi:hemolysin activation/secretion protein
MRAITGILLIGLFVSNLALAAELPPGEEAGAEAARFEKVIKEREKALEKKKVVAPEVEVKKEEARPAAVAVTFILTKVVIKGAKVLRPEDLRPLYTPYIGKKVTFQDIESVIEKIKLNYKEKGCLTSTAYLPEQEIRDGVVEIRVLEGKMGNLKIEGTRWFSSKLIKRQFHTEKDEVLNIRKFQRDVLRLNQNPDVEVKAVLEPGVEPETSDVTLTVKDQFPWHFGAQFDNQGSRLVGGDRTIFTFRDTNATAHNDSLFTSILCERDANAQSISYLLPIDTYGTKVGVSYSHFHLRLGREYKEANVTGDTNIVTPYLLKEFYLSESAEVYGTVGMDVKSIRKHMDDVTTADDQLRIPYLGLDITARDPLGETSFSPRFNFGTSRFLGASKFNHPTATRGETGGFFFKYENEVRRVQRMPFDSYSILRIQFQASTHTLPPSEQLQIGGANSVRGYPEGDFLADTGAVCSIDWIFPMYLFPESVRFPRSDVPLRHQIEPVVFVDFGGGRLNKELPNERRDKFLIGLGGGVRVRLYKNLFCRFEWAEAIGAEILEGSEPSVFRLAIQSEI